MIFYKELAKTLAQQKATVLIEDAGEIVKRTVTGTFATRMGQSSQWGVNIDIPLSDGCTGVTIDFVVDVVSATAKLAQVNINNLVSHMVVAQAAGSETKEEIEKKISSALLSVLNQAQEILE